MIALSIFLAATPINPITKDLPPEKMESVQENKDPSAMLDHLILVQKESLKQLEDLKSGLKEYQALQKKYVENPNDNQTLFRLAKKAEVILEVVQDQHLTYLFDEEQLKELSLFARLAKKQKAPAP